MHEGRFFLGRSSHVLPDLQLEPIWKDLRGSFLGPAYHVLFAQKAPGSVTSLVGGVPVLLVHVYSFARCHDVIKLFGIEAFIDLIRGVTPTLELRC